MIRVYCPDCGALLFRGGKRLFHPPSEECKAPTPQERAERLQPPLPLPPANGETCG